MATSRTGTASHKRFRIAVLQAGRDAGITHCPACGVVLDYDRGRLPDSAEPDHITPWADGGRNDASNGRVLCRRCNQRRGKGRRLAIDQTPKRAITNLIAWLEGWGRDPYPFTLVAPLGIAKHTHGLFPLLLPGEVA